MPGRLLSHHLHVYIYLSSTYDIRNFLLESIQSKSEILPLRISSVRGRFEGNKFDKFDLNYLIARRYIDHE